MHIATGPHTWAEIEPYLNQLFDIPPETREAWLAELAQTQPTLAAALRDFLLEHNKVAASGFLEQPIDAGDDPSLVGQQLGAYTIKSLIGRGGMGEVWLASRSDGRFEGEFAVKFLDSFATSAVSLDRFRREGKLLARLTHANIARLIDAGVNSQNRPYLVLEYVDGVPINEYVKTHSLSVDARVRLMLQVLAAVAHAHSHLVIHRDIKPSNVLITPDGTVKLLDFGVAKLLTAEGSETAAELTRIEDSAFTPEYAAPEQILGEPVSTATDVYQLGVLLFALLAERLPLLTTGAKRTERVKAALESEAPRLSDVAPAPLRKSLRGDLDAIVSKALRKQPSARYATAAALAADLQRFLEHHPVRAREGVLAYRLQKFFRRYRTAAIGTGVAMLALIATATFAVIQMRQAQSQRDELALQARRSDMQAQFVTLMMSSQQSGHTPKETELFLDKGIELLDKHYPNDPAFRANMLINMSGRFMDMGDTEREYDALEKAGAIARQISDNALIAEAECDTVETEIALGHVDRAAQRLAAGKSALSQLENPPPLNVAYCIDAESNYAEALGQSAQAIDLSKQELKLLERAKETRDIQFQSVLSHLALLYSMSGQNKMAFDTYERQLAALRENGQIDTLSYQTAYSNSAVALANFGEERISCERAGEPKVSTQADGSKDVKAVPALNWAICLSKLGKPEESLIWYGTALKVAAAERSFIVQMHAYANRARSLMLLGRYAEADEDLKTVATLAQQDPRGGLRPATKAQIVRAEWLFDQSKLAEARTQLDPVIVTLRTPSSSISSYLPTALLLSARIATAQGRAAEAERTAGEALSISETMARRPELSADVGEALLVLAQAQNARNDHAGAANSAKKAIVALTNGLSADHPLTLEAKQLLTRVQ